MSQKQGQFNYFITALFVFIGVCSGNMVYGNQEIFYILIAPGLILIIWAANIFYEGRRPRVNIVLTKETTPSIQSAIHFKIKSKENVMYLDDCIIVTGYIPKQIDNSFGKRKVVLNYFIKKDSGGNEEDLRVDFNIKHMMAVGNFTHSATFNFLRFRTYTFKFVGGGKKKIRFVYSIRKKPISFIRYWLIVIIYLLSGKIAGIDYWQKDDEKETRIGKMA